METVGRGRYESHVYNGVSYFLAKNDDIATISVSRVQTLPNGVVTLHPIDRFYSWGDAAIAAEIDSKAVSQ